MRVETRLGPGQRAACGRGGGVGRSGGRPLVSAFPARSQTGSLTLHTTSANQSHELITAFSTFQKDGQEPGVTAPLHPQKPLDYFLQLFTLFSLRESAERGRGGGSGINVLNVTTFQQDWRVMSGQLQLTPPLIQLCRELLWDTAENSS